MATRSQHRTPSQTRVSRALRSLAFDLLSTPSHLERPNSHGGTLMSALKALADHFREGDWPMWPILMILVVVWAIIVERIVYLKKAGIDKEKLLALLKSQIMAGNIQGAIKVFSGNPTPVTRIIQAGLTKFNRPDAEVQAAMDEAALRELPRIEKRTAYLAMLGN